MSIVKFPPNPYGVTEAKKGEIDALSLEVLDAKGKVEQYQAIVDSLTSKSQNFHTMLMLATNDRDQALSNKEMVDKVVNKANDLNFHSNTAFNESVLANVQVNTLSVQIKEVMDQLIFSAEIINKLSTLIAKKKQINPIISDEMVSMASTASKDANAAVALALTALESCYSSLNVSEEAEASLSLELLQATQLYETLTGTKLSKTPSKDCIQQLLHTAFDNAKDAYTAALKASNETDDQLDIAQAKLDHATITLQSLESGLAAATAAALAS